MRGDEIVGLELDAVAVRLVEPQNILREQVAVDGRVERERRSPRPEVLDLADGLGSEFGDGASVPQLRLDVAEKTLVARNHHAGRPFLRLDAKELKAERDQLGPGARPLDVCVDG